MYKRKKDIYLNNLEIDGIILPLGMNMSANRKQIQTIVIKWSEFWQIKTALNR